MKKIRFFLEKIYSESIIHCVYNNFITGFARMNDYKEINSIIGEWDGKLLHYAEQFLLNRDAAQNVVQNVFVQYIRYRREHDGERINPGVWLLRAVRNACRKEQHGAMVFLSFPFPVPGGSDEVCAMRQKISSLDAADQELLFLHFSEKKRYEEIAEITGNNLPATAKLIAAAVQRLNDLGGVA